MCCVSRKTHLFFLSQISQNTFFLSFWKSLRTHGNSGIPFSVLPLLQQYVSVFQTLTVSASIYNSFRLFFLPSAATSPEIAPKIKRLLFRIDLIPILHLWSLLLHFHMYSHMSSSADPAPKSQDGFCDALSYSNILISSCVSKVMPQRSLFCKSHQQE